MSSSFGKNIRVQIFGQSHSQAIGVVIDGLPAGETVDPDFIYAFMARRAPGKNRFSTSRNEADEPRILSGVFEGKTCGAPLCAVIENKDTRSQDYANLRDVPRPSHADYTAEKRYGGYQDYRGGGHFSGRLTAPLCFAGAVCMSILSRRGITIGAHVFSIGSVEDDRYDAVNLTADTLLAPQNKPFPVICADAGERMAAEIDAARQDGDSVGGIVECAAIGLPAGVGSPIFDAVESRLSAVLFGIPAVRGVEFGLGFAACAMRGSAHNDAFVMDGGHVRTATNHSGGIQGGITNGMPLIFRVGFKPTPSIAIPQSSVSLSQSAETTLQIHGRHDPCIVLRALPCVEAAAATVLLDLLCD